MEPSPGLAVCRKSLMFFMTVCRSRMRCAGRCTSSRWSGRWTWALERREACAGSCLQLEELAKPVSHQNLRDQIGGHCKNQVLTFELGCRRGHPRTKCLAYQVPGWTWACTKCEVLYLCTSGHD
jgi:hypothetical protein